MNCDLHLSKVLFRTIAFSMLQSILPPLGSRLKSSKQLAQLFSPSH